MEKVVIDEMLNAVEETIDNIDRQFPLDDLGNVIEQVIDTIILLKDVLRGIVGEE